MTYCVQGKFCPRFILALSPENECKTGPIESWIICKKLCKKIGELVNSRLCEPVSDLYRAKIKLDKFKAVYKNPNGWYHVAGVAESVICFMYICLTAYQVVFWFAYIFSDSNTGQVWSAQKQAASVHPLPTVLLPFSCTLCTRQVRQPRIWSRQSSFVDRSHWKYRNDGGLLPTEDTCLQSQRTR